MNHKYNMEITFKKYNFCGQGLLKGFVPTFFISHKKERNELKFYRRNSKNLYLRLQFFYTAPIIFFQFSTTWNKPSYTIRAVNVLNFAILPMIETTKAKPTIETFHRGKVHASFDSVCHKVLHPFPGRGNFRTFRITLNLHSSGSKLEDNNFAH